MSVKDLANKLTQYFSWLYYQRQWTQWELLTIAITALVLLLLIANRRRKKGARKNIQLTFKGTRPSSVLDSTYLRGY
jgi:hypothetical protein